MRSLTSFIYKQVLPSMTLVLLSALMIANTACKSKKKTVDEAIPTEMMDVLPAINQANLPVNIVQARGKGKVKGLGISQGFKVDLRHRNDSVIWVDVSANLLGIKVARLMVTPDSVHFYNKLDKTYLSGSVVELQKLVDGPVDFRDLQAMITGKPIELPNNIKQIAKEEGAWIFVKNSSERITRMWFDADNHALIQQSVNFPKEKQELSATYRNTSSTIPELLIFSTVINGQDVEVEISFDQIDSQSAVLFPFTIPRGYKSL